MSWTKFSKLTLFAVTIALAHSSWASDKKDCVECTYKKVVGAPDLGNLEKIAKVARTNLKDEEFIDYQLTFCMKFEQVNNNYGFKKEILESMKKTQYTVDKFWTEPGCVPKRIGNTEVPLIHLTAEDARSRKLFLETLYKYYQERNENNQWIKIVNAKNTMGYTILDYIDYLNSSGTLRPDERKDINGLITFLCERGAVFSHASNKKCPMQI